MFIITHLESKIDFFVQKRLPAYGIPRKNNPKIRNKYRHWAHKLLSVHICTNIIDTHTQSHILILILTYSGFREPLHQLFIRKFANANYYVLKICYCEPVKIESNTFHTLEIWLAHRIPSFFLLFSYSSLFLSAKKRGKRKKNFLAKSDSNASRAQMMEERGNINMNFSLLIQFCQSACARFDVCFAVAPPFFLISN